MASSCAARITPSACEATPMRPASSALSATLNPSPSAPSRFLAGIRISSSERPIVSEPRSPILSSAFPRRRPGVPFSTMKAEMPRLPAARSVRAKIR